MRYSRSAGPYFALLMQRRAAGRLFFAAWESCFVPAEEMAARQEGRRLQYFTNSDKVYINVNINIYMNV